MKQRMDLDTVRARVKQRASDITPQLEKAAAFLFAKPDDVALLSMREFAGRAGLPPATFFRLARTLGFSGYPELRAVFVDRIRRSSNVYSPRAAQLQRRDGEDQESAVVKKIFASKLENIERTFERNPSAKLLEIVSVLEKADRLFLLGQRSCYPIVFFFRYVLELFSERTVAINDIGGTFADELRYIKPDDVLFAVSFRPYTRTSVRATEYAASLGCKIIAMTDSELSPLNLQANHTLFVDTAAPSFVHSIVEPLIVVDALLALLMARGGQAAIDNLRKSEHQLSRFEAYWATPSTKRRRYAHSSPKGPLTTSR